MKKIHVVAVALLLAAAAVAGLVAATRTAGFGASARQDVSGRMIAARTRRLDRVEAALRRALRDRPPALPTAPAATTRSSQPPALVVYRRPAPIVVIKHGSHHDGEAEHGSEGGDD